MGYTKDVDKGSRNPGSTAYRSFISLLPPFYFVKCRKRPGSVPPRTGALPCPAGARQICKKPFKDCSRFVHKLACPVQYTMIVGRENTHPSGELLFTPCFLSFTFSFYPLFHFALVCALLPSPLGSRAFPFAPGSFSNRNKSFTGRSKSVHIWGGGMGYTKDVDKGSRNPESTAYRSFISLLPPFFKSV